MLGLACNLSNCLFALLWVNGQDWDEPGRCVYKFDYATCQHLDRAPALLEQKIIYVLPASSVSNVREFTPSSNSLTTVVYAASNPFDRKAFDQSNTFQQFRLA